MSGPPWEANPLMGTIWKTKNSRFNAADRLRRRHWWKTIALGVMSIYILALSVLPKFLTTDQASAEFDFVGFTPVVASVLVLVLSIMTAFDEDVVRSKYLYDNAKALSNLYHHYKLFAESAPTAEELNEFGDRMRKRYDKAMGRCPYNHDDLDFKKTLLDIARDSKMPRAMLAIRCGIGELFDIYFWPVVAMLFPWAFIVPWFLA